MFQFSSAISPMHFTPLYFQLPVTLTPFYLITISLQLLLSQFSLPSQVIFKFWLISSIGLLLVAGSLESLSQNQRLVFACVDLERC